MTIPHIGSTGVIQNLGVLGAAAQGLQGLPQILLALQQQKAQQSRDAINAQLAQAQIHNYDVDNQRQQGIIDTNNAANKSLAEGLARYNTPQGMNPMPPTDLGNGAVLPSFTQGNPQNPVYPSAGEVIGGLHPGAAKSFDELTKSTELDRQKQASFRATKQALTKLLVGKGTQAEVSAAIQNLPPNVDPAELVKEFNQLKTKDGAFHLAKVQVAAGQLHYFYVQDPSSERPGRQIDTGLQAPADAGVTVNLSPGERDAGALTIGAEKGLTQIKTILEGGYNPAQESGWAKLGSYFKTTKVVGGLAKALESAKTSTQGKLLVSATERVVRNYVYAVSGKQVTRDEREEQIRQTMYDLFDDPTTFAQKVQTLESKVTDEMRFMAGRSQLPEPTVEKIKLPGVTNDSTAKYQDEARRLKPKIPGE